LKKNSKIYLDQNGIYHIETELMYDLFYLLGFVSAQTRFYQTLSLRILVLGRLAEFLGEQFLPVDKFFRALGLGKLGKEDHEVYKNSDDPKDRESVSLAQAMCDGLNDWIDHPDFQLPVEAWLGGLKVEKFTVADMFTIARMLSLSMSKAWALKLHLAEICSMLPPKFHDYLRPLYEATEETKNPHVWKKDEFFNYACYEKFESDGKFLDKFKFRWVEFLGSL